MSRKNYLYVDFENKRDIDLSRVAGRPVEVILAIGPQTKALPLILVEQILSAPGQVRLLKSVKMGRNALDLLMASDLGAVRDRDPAGFFHILSGDKDFDSLKDNLRAQNIMIERRESVSEIPILMDEEERLALLKKRLSGENNKAPKSRESLVKFIQAQFNQALSASELDQAVDGLRKAGMWGDKTTKTSAEMSDGSPRAGVSAVPRPKSSKPLPGVGERVQMVRAALARIPKSRPSKEATLRSYINDLFRKEVPETAMKKTLAALKTAKVLEIDPVGKVSYPK